MKLSRLIKALSVIENNDESNLFEGLEPAAWITYLKSLPEAKLDVKTAEPLRTFLAQRWERIRGGKFDYTFAPHEKMSQMCLLLARILKETVYKNDDSVCAYQLLMPSITQVKSELTLRSIDTIPFAQLVLSDDGTAVINAASSIRAAKETGVLCHTTKYDVDNNKGIPLSETERSRVYNHSPALTALYKASEARRTYQGRKKGSIGEFLRQIASRLLDAGAVADNVKNELEKVGKTFEDLKKEVRANQTTILNNHLAHWQHHFAFKHLLRKLEKEEDIFTGGKEYVMTRTELDIADDLQAWYEALPESVQKDLDSRKVKPDSTDTFKDLYDRLIGRYKIQSAEDTAVCVEVIARDLEMLLDNNKDLDAIFIENTNVHVDQRKIKLEQNYNEKNKAVDDELVSHHKEKLAYTQADKKKLASEFTQEHVKAVAITNFAEMKTAFELVSAEKRIDILKCFSAEYLYKNIFVAANRAPEPVASVSHPFTYLAGMLANDAHRLQLFEIMDRYLPKMIGTAKAIQVTAGHLFGIFHSAITKRKHVKKFVSVVDEREHKPSYPKAYDAWMASCKRARRGVSKQGVFAIATTTSMGAAKVSVNTVLLP